MPKRKMNEMEIIAWAKKAAAATGKINDPQEDTGYFDQLARESGLGARWLTYYANAYEAAGESGIKALSYRKKPEQFIIDDARMKIDKYLEEQRKILMSTSASEQIEYETRVFRNNITAYEKRHFYKDPTEMTSLAIFQVRYTDYDRRWHLFWMRKFNVWWPYIPDQPVLSIEDCIQEVERDRWGCFWG